MKSIKGISLVLLVGLMAFGCSNKEMESRIAKLEGKVAELETKNGTRATTPAPAAIVEPEVAPEGPVPAFKFEEESFDFGNITEGDVVDHVFTFTNTGDAPLIIASATASCGCTVPVWPKEPIPVGGKGEIKVQFNSQGKPGPNSKQVTITANTFPKISRLNIKSNVNPKQNPS